MNIIFCYYKICLQLNKPKVNQLKKIVDQLFAILKNIKKLSQIEIYKKCETTNFQLIDIKYRKKDHHC